MRSLLMLSLLISAAYAVALAAPAYQTGYALTVPRGRDVPVDAFVTMTGGPAVVKTTATVRWDDASLGLTFTCDDAHIVAQHYPRDGDGIWQNDTVEIFLDPGHTHDYANRWVHLLVTARGDVLDERGPAFFYSSGALRGGDTGYTAAKMKARITRTADGWRAEIVIPWKDIGARPAPGDVWGVNFNRTQQPEGEYLCWTPTGGPFLRIHQWGHLLFAGADGNAGQARQTMEAKHALLIERDARKPEYINRVLQGDGFMPWQAHESVSGAERAFRAAVEQRKEAMLAKRVLVRHPALFSDDTLACAKRNIAETAWGKAWFEQIKAMADDLVAQPEDYVARMIPEQTPTSAYGFTCPHCVGTKSLEGSGVAEWDYRQPDILRCGICGQVYPDAQYPETGVMQCPRRGQTFTYYVNDAERAHPEDRSGKYAWKWTGKPMHVSFTGIIRERKVRFMGGAARTLALAYQLTGDPRYAAMSMRILQRFTACVPNWLYHDYWGTFADCDPLYAAWHDQQLPLEWKRHSSGSAYAADTPTEGKMLQSYWGAGRMYSSADTMVVNQFACAYDLTYNATGADGTPLWTPDWRRRVERELMLEYLIGAEPFVGGAGKAENITNKAPYVYYPMATVARVLGLANYADVALRGYAAIRDQSFLPDGFSRESPSYTNMFLSNLIQIPETLQGFRWPRGFPGHAGTVNVFRDDLKLARIMRTAVETLQADGRFLPLSDTPAGNRPSSSLFEIGLQRYPELFAGTLAFFGKDYRPSEYAVFHYRDADLAPRVRELPETVFPSWKTVVLRHGDSVLALPFNPHGNHRHTDNLALFYADRGQTILGELGYVGDSAMLGWGRTTLSHNLVVVDGQEQRFTDRAPSLRLFAASPRVSVAEASSTAYAQCRAYRRTVALVKGPGSSTFAVDIFRVTGGKQHAYQVFSELASSDAQDGALTLTGVMLPEEKPLPNFGGSTAKAHVFGLRDPRAAAPPAAWQAVWSDNGGRYRLHVLGQADEVVASNGPGQESLTQAGRRLRYLEIINRGTDLSSTFVTVHEPDSPDGFPITAAERLPVPAHAGPDAVALRIDSRWGQLLIFSDFAQPCEVAGVRFQGQFGVFGATPEGKSWRLTCGESVWTGKVRKHTTDTLTVDTPRPADWPELPAGVTASVLLGEGTTWTGYPVAGTARQRITVGQFPLTDVTMFALPSVRYTEEATNAAQ